MVAEKIRKIKDMSVDWTRSFNSLGIPCFRFTTEDHDTALLEMDLFVCTVVSHRIPLVKSNLAEALILT